MATASRDTPRTATGSRGTPRTATDSRGIPRTATGSRGTPRMATGSRRAAGMLRTPADSRRGIASRHGSPSRMSTVSSRGKVLPDRDRVPRGRASPDRHSSLVPVHRRGRNRPADKVHRRRVLPVSKRLPDRRAAAVRLCTAAGKARFWAGCFGCC